MKLPEGIELFSFSHPGFKSPAMFSRSNNAIYVNEYIWNDLSKPQQDFILCHELGHIHTRDELEADFLGFKRFTQLGYTPKQAVEAINSTLTFSRPEHATRFHNVVYNAAAYDYLINKNKNSLKILTMYTPEIEYLSEADIDHLRDQLAPMGVTDDDLHSFLGMGKKARERREEKQAQRAANKADKNSRKNQKADARAALIEARADAKLRGGNSGNGMNIFNKVADTANNIFGKASSDPEDSAMTANEIAAYEAAEEKKQMTTYIVIGVVVVVIIGVAIYLTKSNKKKGK